MRKQMLGEIKNLAQVHSSSNSALKSWFGETPPYCYPWILFSASQNCFSMHTTKKFLWDSNMCLLDDNMYMLSHFSHVWFFVTLWTVAPRLLCPWNSPAKNIGVDSHAFLQGIFLTQGSNPCLLYLLHCRWILCCWAIKKTPLIIIFLFNSFSSEILC